MRTATRLPPPGFKLLSRRQAAATSQTALVCSASRFLRLFEPGREITAAVDKPGWAIWQPLEGKTPIPQGLLTIQLLPKGSKRFWTDKFIQTFIEDTAEKAKLQVKLADRQENQKPVDFGPLIKEWASKYGFSPEEAKGQIDKWVAEVQAAQEDFYKLGLAAYAEHNFRKAGELFDEAGQNSERQLAAATKQAAEAEATRSRLLALRGKLVRDPRGLLEILPGVA
jgi:hypothetical protein